MNFFTSLKTSSRYIGVYACHHPILWKILYILWKKDKVPVLFTPKMPANHTKELIHKTGIELFIDCHHNKDNHTSENVAMIEKMINVLSIEDTHFFSQKYSDLIFPTQNYPIQWSNVPSNAIFTSGSIEKKAIVHTFSNHYYSALGSMRNLPLCPSDIWLASLPFHHIGGLSIFFRTYLTGSGMLFPSSPRVKDLKKKILEFSGITHISLVAAQLESMIKSNELTDKMRSMKAILLGGSAIPYNLIKNAIEKKLPIHLSYGSSEMTSQIATTERINSIENIDQKVLPYRKVTVRDKEILVKGPTLFLGYLKNGKIIRHSPKDSWYNTKDLGLFNSNYSLTILGRKDSMFISGGENIYPEVLEKIINRHPLIENSLVIPINNERFGKVPVTFLWLKNNSLVKDEKNIFFEFEISDLLNTYIEQNLEKFYRSHYYINARHPQIIKIANLMGPSIKSSIKISRVHYRKIAEKLF